MVENLEEWLSPPFSYRLFFFGVRGIRIVCLSALFLERGGGKGRRGKSVGGGDNGLNGPRFRRKGRKRGKSGKESSAKKWRK